MTSKTENGGDDTESPAMIKEPRLWCDKGWTARVIKNEDDDGWAVEMIRQGEREPALVGPWTMGRDKKNPKPLDATAFNTLVKTASEFVLRQVQQRHAVHHKSVTINTDSGPVTVTLDIVADEYDPYAILRACDTDDQLLAEARVDPGFNLSRATANTWIEGGFRKVGRPG